MTILDILGMTILAFVVGGITTIVVVLIACWVFLLATLNVRRSNED